MKFQDLNIGDVFAVNAFDKVRFTKVESNICHSPQGERIPVPLDCEVVKIEVRNRFDDALEIQGGAVNIRAIARALLKAADESANSQVQPSDDAAVRLIVHQLAFLCGIEEIEHPKDVETSIGMMPGESPYPTLAATCRASCNFERNRK